MFSLGSSRPPRGRHLDLFLVSISRNRALPSVATGAAFRAGVVFTFQRGTSILAGASV